MSYEAGEHRLDEQRQKDMLLPVRYVWLGLVVIATVMIACTPRNEPDRASTELITIPDLTGLSRSYAIRLIDNLELEIHVKHIDPSDVDDASPSRGGVASGRFPGDTVLRQRPGPDTKVAPGATITLFVPTERNLRRGEEKFRLITHCGLSFPLEFDHQFWLPVDRKLRRTITPPDGFSSDGFYDMGTIRRIDRDTLMYTSSTGIEVEYEPTGKRPGGCE